MPCPTLWNKPQTTCLYLALSFAAASIFSTSDSTFDYCHYINISLTFDIDIEIPQALRCVLYCL